MSAVDKAFFTAIAGGKETKVGFLLEEGVDINLQDASSGRNGLHVAVDLGNSKMAEFLIVKGINVNHKDFRGLSPLQLSCAFGNLELARKLLDKGANVNIVDNFGYAPIHSAIFFGRSVVIDLLLSRGADTSLVTNEGLSALQIAENTGNFLVSSKIMKHMEGQKRGDIVVASPEGIAKLVAHAESGLDDIDLNVDTTYSPTDTYGALKHKLDKANAILDKLREKKK